MSEAEKIFNQLKEEHGDIEELVKFDETNIFEINPCLFKIESHETSNIFSPSFDLSTL